MFSSNRALIGAFIVPLIPIYYFAASYQGILKSNNLSNNESVNSFVQQALHHQVSDPFNISVISDLCLNRKPRDDVIVRCAAGTGGVGNIRSYMLHCTRFAMETGGSMILPRFHGRSPKDLFELFGDKQDFEHFFDRDWFKDTLTKACPHMTVYDYQSSDWTDLDESIPGFGGAINVSTPAEPSPWRQDFDKWIEEKIKEKADGKEKPYVVQSVDPGRDRAVMDDGMDFYYNYGRLLEFRPDVRRLAALATAELSRRFNLNMDPSANYFKNAYFGAHLRTSSDAVKAGWNPDFEEQTNNYMKQAREANVTVIYVASGNDEDIKRWAIKAKQQEGMDVVCKYDLLSGNDLRELNNFSWDQKGLLDFEILLKSTSYGGYARSSFSHNVAFRRHFLSNVEDPFADEHDHFADELSRVYGRFDAGWEAEGVRTMWP